MRRRSYRYLAAIALLPLATGCVQATRHSNTMLFGTNTTFGIKAGTATGETPSIVVGYDRQEAVIMPLVANTAKNSNSNNLLDPCDLTKDVMVGGTAKYAVHPCSLVAVNGKAMDSYSVLASFGAQFDANGQGAKGGLAQYFSTGIAAQLLAATGGASVVATGNAAALSAAKAPDANETINSLYGDTAEFKVGRELGNAYNDFSDRLSAKIALTPQSALQQKMQSFEAAVASGSNVAAACTSKDRCQQAAKQQFAVSYGFNPSGYETALNSWTTDTN